MDTFPNFDEAISYHDIHYTHFNSLQNYEGILNFNIFLEDIFFGNFYGDDNTIWP